MTDERDRPGLGYNFPVIQGFAGCDVCGVKYLEFCVCPGPYGFDECDVPGKLIGKSLDGSVYLGDDGLPVYADDTRKEDEARIEALRKELGR